MAKKKTKWFYKTRGSYLPKTLPGWLTYIPYLAYLIGVLVFVLQRRDNFWLGVFTVVPNYVAAVIILTWIAKHKS
jgi:uncharacterized membrane protein (GlpM family)